MHIRKVSMAAVLCGLVATSTSACLSGGGNDSSSGGSGGGQGSAKTTISIMYAFSGDQNVAFKKELDDWGAKQSPALKFDYNQSDNFQNLITTKIQAGDPPDIAIFPQPGILKSLATKGKVAELSTQTDVEKVKSSIIPGFLDAATVNGKVYGAPMAMNIKSLYWYDKATWKQKGYEVPKTQAELEALLAKMKSDGVAPMCFGLGSGPATGWPGTDWIEDYVLQTGGKDVYKKWVDHEIKFDSPEVRKAFDIYNKLVLTDGYMYGGRQNAASIQFATALNPMFAKPPKCLTGKQGNFITQKGFFPDTIFKDIDNVVGVFQTPSVNGEHPVLGAGDLAAALTKNDSNVKKVMEHMVADPKWGESQAATGAWLSPNKSFDDSKYPNNTLREIAKIAKNATVLGFDGSDAMPGAVGSGSFWTGMVNYTTGKADLDATLKAIDDSWPAS
ncbi:ABC transporter substrate-binding protein [Arsenicicoccus sp. oral taxon 190]|uniref:ABC transporter substrate-binding protein n=1 Tax=Arsenicicoccus sp. oral taxon 190 TaxID=1658671 RepID=UPI000679F470|nr:ABC transporter substrate-binding protein [Arsenicicoccus sp. oral taxon 190]AKT51325.1 hypothetical protein ADJ73_08315 [Arsenicicoccus sp. oral taxon 190]